MSEPCDSSTIDSKFISERIGAYIPPSNVIKQLLTTLIINKIKYFSLVSDYKPNTCCLLTAKC